ncbi:MAG: hypothetical protein F4062_02575 [Acidimicrobiia bacterium]|nr:hypothetical protein [Acidimicrobiia bacterium]
MESGNLELIITAVSITGTILAAVLAAFGFLHRELRRLDAKVDRRFERMGQSFDEKLERMGQSVNERFERIDEGFDGLRTVLTSVQVSVARIEGHLGIGFPARGEQRADDEPPERAA